MTEGSGGLNAVIKAADFAAWRHGDGERGHATLRHVLSVTHTLTRHGVKDTVVLRAALLHHTLSDTRTTADELIEQFGHDVASLVAEATFGLRAEQGDPDPAHIAHELSDRAKLITLADHACTAAEMATLPYSDLEYLEWSSAVVRGCRGVNRFLDELCDRTLAGAREAARASIADPAPDDEWAVRSRDLFDRDASDGTAGSGTGLGRGLARLWECHLSDGIGGLLQYYLTRRTPEGERTGIRIEGSAEGGLRLREWVFGTRQSVRPEHFEAREVRLLRDLGNAHAHLVLAGRSAATILDAAADAQDLAAFLREL